MRLVHVVVGTLLMSLAVSGCGGLSPDAQRVYDRLLRHEAKYNELPSACDKAKDDGASEYADFYVDAYANELKTIPRADLLAGVEQFMKWCDGN